jgi:hypothetical protein
METWGEKEMWGVGKEIFNNFNQNVSLTSVLVGNEQFCFNVKWNFSLPTPHVSL